MLELRQEHGCIMGECNMMLWHWGESTEDVIILVVPANSCAAKGELWMEWDSVKLWCYDYWVRAPRVLLFWWRHTLTACCWRGLREFLKNHYHFQVSKYRYFLTIMLGAQCENNRNCAHNVVLNVIFSRSSYILTIKLYSQDDVVFTTARQATRKKIGHFGDKSSAKWWL